MNAPYALRLFKSTIAVALACLQQSVRQQWFLLTFIPFIAVVLTAPYMPATSQTAAYRLIVKAVLGGGSVILFVGLILACASSLPAEVRDKTVHRSVASPGGRFSMLTGRIIAFCLLAALAALIGTTGTLASLSLYSLQTESSREFSTACRHYRASAASGHNYSGVTEAGQSGGVQWVDEKSPFMEWIFPASLLTRNGTLRLRIVPVVASTLETHARLTAGRTGSKDSLSQGIELFDNRPTDIKFPTVPGEGSLRVRIERLSDSAPFGFDTTKNELRLEKNGVSLLTGTRLFSLNLLAAWLVVWLKMSFAASLAIFTSTFLSMPVAAAFSLVLFLLANVLGFLREFASGLLHPAGCGCIHCHFAGTEHAPTAFDKVINSLLVWFTALYPDLSRFDAAEALVWGIAIPAGFVLLALLYLLCYSGILWGASALILRRKEF